MKRLLEPQTARILTGACLLVIVVLSLVPGSARPHTMYPGQVEHFMAYAGTGFVSGFAYRALRERLSVWIGLAIASGLLEIMQQFVPGRSPSVFDALASTSGLTVGLILGAGLSTVLSQFGRSGTSRESC